jgi:hypothetical protein
MVWGEKIVRTEFINLEKVILKMVMRWKYFITKFIFFNIYFYKLGGE